MLVFRNERLRCVVLRCVFEIPLRHLFFRSLRDEAGKLGTRRARDEVPEARDEVREGRGEAREARDEATEARGGNAGSGQGRKPRKQISTNFNKNFEIC